MVKRPFGRRLLIGAVYAFLGVFLIVPLAAIITHALGKGLGAYFRSLGDPDALASIRLTLLAGCVAVVLNTAFGVAAAWAIGKFQFAGKNVLLALIDLPLAVSPVIAGLVFVLVFGLRGWLGPWLAAHDVKIIFAVPGIVLALSFVSLPFVARELIPMFQLGDEEEVAALSLGASGWQTLFYVTLPNARWGLFHGIILCTARAMGDYGAVSVVSGHIQGVTTTMPLQVEILYNSHDAVGAFAVASLLAMFALVTLAAKRFVEYKSEREP